MRYLLDTNIFIDMVAEDYISADIVGLTTNYENLIYVSSESVKEYLHLMQAGKLRFKKEIYLLDVFDLIEDKLGFQVKYVTKEHLRTFAKLDRIEGHNDPSDRLIIAQALTEKMPVISSDAKFPKYRKMGLELIFNE